MKKLTLVAFVILSTTNVLAMSESSKKKCTALADVHLNQNTDVVASVAKPAEKAKSTIMTRP